MQSQNSDVKSNSSVHTYNQDTIFFCAYTPKGSCPMTEPRLLVQEAWLGLLTWQEWRECGSWPETLTEVMLWWWGEAGRGGSPEDADLWETRSCSRFLITIYWAPVPGWVYLCAVRSVVHTVPLQTLERPSPGPSDHTLMSVTLSASSGAGTLEEHPGFIGTQRIFLAFKGTSRGDMVATRGWTDGGKGGRRTPPGQKGHLPEPGRTRRFSSSIQPG